VGSLQSSHAPRASPVEPPGAPKPNRAQWGSFILRDKAHLRMRLVRRFLPSSPSSLPKQSLRVSLIQSRCARLPERTRTDDPQWDPSAMPGMPKMAPDTCPYHPDDRTAGHGQHHARQAPAHHPAAPAPPRIAGDEADRHSRRGAGGTDRRPARPGTRHRQRDAAPAGADGAGGPAAALRRKVDHDQRTHVQSPAAQARRDRRRWRARAASGGQRAGAKRPRAPSPTRPAKSTSARRISRKRFSAGGWIRVYSPDKQSWRVPSPVFRAADGPALLQDRAQPFSRMRARRDRCAA
jgi:hypothetical protein